MSIKRFITSYAYLSKLGLSILLGYSALANALYAAENNNANTIGDYITTFFGEHKASKAAYLAAITAKETEKAADILKEVSKNKRSAAQKAALAYLGDEKNAEAIYTWASTHDPKSVAIWSYIQNLLKEMCAASEIYPYEYQLAHAPLDKNAHLKAVATYLQELENVQHSYKVMSHKALDTPVSTGLETCKEYIKLQNQIILNRLKADLVIWKKQLKDLKKLLNSHPNMLSATDSATYSRVSTQVARLQPDSMEAFLAEITQHLRAQEHAAPRYFPRNDFTFDLEGTITILKQAVKNSQIKDISSAYRVALKHLLYMLSSSQGPNNTPRVSYVQIDQLLAHMAKATQIIHTHNTADKSFAAASSKDMVPAMGLLGGALGVGLFGLLQNVKNKQIRDSLGTNGHQNGPVTHISQPGSGSTSKTPTTSQNPAGRFSWPSLSRTKRGTALAASALVTLGIGYQVYQQFFRKEKKASTTPVAPASPQKRWIILMLVLLLCGILGAGLFYRKQAAPSPS